MRNAIRIVIATLAWTAVASAGVTIGAPAPGATSGSPVHFAASASSSRPVTAMRIYVDNVSVFATSSGQIDTSVPLGTGRHSIVVQAWDSGGAVFTAPETITVSAAPPGGGVTVSSIANGATVSSPMRVAASASSSHPITAMAIYLDGNSVFTGNAASLDTSVNASAGPHSLTVQAWDATGAVFKDVLEVNVSSGSGGNPPPGAVTKTEIQQMPGWQNCTVCAGAGGNGPSATFSMVENQASPSLSGHSAKFSIGGSTPFSDAIWWKQLGGDNAAKNFKYDLDFFLTSPQLPQALEFDVNQSDGNTKFIFGTQCDIKGAGVWDVWDTAGGTWRSTGVRCTAPAAFAWHHLTWEFQRTDNQVRFLTLTLDGATHFINQTYNAKPVSASEVNVAFQIDGDFAQHPYSAWLDNVTLSYW